MILSCNFEELGALRQGARAFLGETARQGASVAAPPKGQEQVENLLPRLSGDLAIETLAEQRLVFQGVSAIVSFLRQEMELIVISTHPADEAAVSSYFSFAHALAVQARLAEMGQEMEALIEVVTGAPATAVVAATFLFPS
jgi:hypothetical protein